LQWRPGTIPVSFLDLQLALEFVSSGGLSRLAVGQDLLAFRVRSRAVRST